MGQAQALVLNMFEQGFLFAFLGLGVLVTFRFFRFPDLTAECSYPLGGAVPAALLAAGELVWCCHTEVGLAARATGENETMALSLGVNVGRAKMVGLALSNGLIALSGALVAQNHGFADIGMGIGILVTGAAAVLIGEAIFGDRTVAVWVLAAIVGVLLYRLLVALALRVGLEPIDLRLVTALLLL